MIIRPLLPLAVLIVALVVVAVGLVFCIINRPYRTSKSFIKIGILLAVIAALFRPMIIVDGKANVAASNTVIYFIVDSTGSMATEDEAGKSRIEAARNDMNRIIDGFVAPKIGAFVQDVITYQSLPITSDVGAARKLVNTVLVKDTISSEGTDIKKLLKSASTHFKEYKKENADATMVVFIMSDGDNNEDSNEHDLQRDDFKYAAYGAVIGYGSTSGGKVPHIKRKDGMIDYYQDETEPYLKKGGEYIISRKNESFLKVIANTYSFRYGSSGDVDSIISEAKKSATKPTIDDDAIDTSSAFEMYWIFMIVAGILLLAEFSKDFNSLLEEREVKK